MQQYTIECTLQADNDPFAVVIVHRGDVKKV